MKIDKFFRSIIRSELLFNTSVLVSGTVLAQIIPVLLQPVLRRPFSAEAFGAYSVYTSLIGIIVIITSFRYELAIIIPKNEKVAANVFFLTIIINFLFNLLILLIVIIWHRRITGFLNLSGQYANYIFLVPAATFLLNSYQSINYWLIRQKKFTEISVNKFVRRGFEGATQVSLKFFRIPHFLVYGDITGHISNFVAGFYQAFKSGLNLNLMSIRKLKYVLVKYDEYPKFSLIPGLMSACSSLLPAIFINKFYSLENAGFIDLSKTVLSVPLAMVALSLSSVLLQRISEKYKNSETIKSELVSVLWIIFAISLIEIIVILLFGVELFSFIFGSKWGFSGTISKILVWSYAFNFIVNSFNSIFIALNRIKILSLWQLIYFIAILSLLFFKGLPFLDFVKLYVGIELLCAFLIIAFMISIIRKYETGLKYSSLD